ncbi:MAG: YidC/Oxa1 family membrane protein insertase [Solirubrobacterales bacterium]
MILANVFQPLIDIADALIVFLHDDVGLSWGWSIVGLTVIVRLAMVPLTIKQIKSMNALRALQPQMKEIQEKYKGDRQKMNQAMMRFYQENKVNPFASCLPLLLQLPVFMALFFLLNGQEFKDQVAASGQTDFLLITDITAKATGAELVVLMVLFIVSQMASTLVMSVTADKTQQRIMLLLPLVFAAFIPNFPAGLIVYWITTNFWTLGQQVVVRRLSPPPPVVGAAGPAVALADGGTASPAKKPPPPPRKKRRRRR